MNEKEIILKIEEYSLKQMENKEPGHDFLHVTRVRRLANIISKDIDCDHFLVDVLALLHDINDHKFDTNNDVIKFLKSFDIEDVLINKIDYILKHMSFSKYPVLPDDFPIEGKIIQDADRLDAIGAIGVARAFSYGGNKNRKMYGSNDSTLQHFDDKLLKLQNYLYLDKSKEIASKRAKFIQDFYNEFIEEINY